MRLNNYSSRRAEKIAILVTCATLLLVAAVGALARSTYAYSSDSFVVVVKTDNTGTSASNQFTIPTMGSGYNYSIDCQDDGVLEVVNRTVSAAYTCTYDSPGTYTIAITGAFPRISFNNGGDVLKLLEIQQWGAGTWTSMQNAFYGAANMDVTATDVPVFASNMNLSSMFRGAINLVGNTSFNAWNVSNATSMASMFQEAIAFNQPIGDWNTENVTNMSSMFNGALSFDQPIDDWNVSRVTNMTAMFRGPNTSFNQPLNSWNTSSVTNMSNMFRHSPAFDQPLDNWDVSKVTTINGMFLETPFNQNINSWNTASLVSFSHTFQGATAFNQPLDNWDVSNVKNFSRLFYGATVFNQPLGNWDTSSATNMALMFHSASTFNQSLASWNMTNIASYTDYYTSLNEMFSYSGLSSANYDDSLESWSTQDVNDNIRLSAYGVKYCGSATERASFINDHSWVIAYDRICDPTVNVPEVGFVTNNATLAFTGTGAPGATIYLSGAITASITVAPDGTWAYTHSTLIADGDGALIIYQDDQSLFTVPTFNMGMSYGTYSESNGLSASFKIDTVAPAKPTATISAGGDFVTGTAEPHSSITVTASSGATCNAVASASGDWSCILSAALGSGEAIVVTATDAAGNVSGATTVSRTEDVDAGGAGGSVSAPNVGLITMSANTGATLVGAGLLIIAGTFIIMASKRAIKR